MKKEEESQQLTAAQQTSQAILSMPLHESYVPVPDIPLPLQYGVIIKPLQKPTIETLESGLLLSTGDNTQDTCDGIIYSVGPLCSPYLRVGLRCQYSAEIKTGFRHRGVEYKKMDEFSVYFILPDPKTVVDNGVKSDKQIGREKRQQRQKDFIPKDHARTQNEIDRKKESKKGKIVKVK